MSLPERGTEREHRRVRALDPLHADDLLRHLPAMNAAGDVPALVDTLRRLVAAATPDLDADPYRARAAMRDLGVLLGSIKRHDLEPVTEVPEVEPVLLRLADRGDVVPRDTVHHYSVWNPHGERQRSYTGDPQESALIDSVRLSLPRLARAVDQCVPLAEAELTSPGFLTAMGSFRADLSSLDEAIELVIDRVSPAFFAQDLRPYFGDVTVGGQVWLGGAGAGLPVPLLDLTLWAADHGDAGYETFWRQGIPYALPEWRRLYPRLATGPSLVTRVSEALAKVGAAEPDPRLMAAATAVEQSMRALLGFRAKHVTVARKSYQEDLRLFPVGSSGGSVELLASIVRLTRDNAALVRGRQPGGAQPDEVRAGSLSRA
ncbi:MAG TPA: monodechloroaminopyrrolnitrin synthase PrnB family protein [Actinocatenispora sp.]